MTVEKTPLPTELIDALLANYKKLEEDLFGQDDILRQLSNQPVSDGQAENP